MKRRNGNAPAFKQLLAQTASDNAGRLMNRARAANPLTKIVRCSIAHADIPGQN